MNIVERLNKVKAYRMKKKRRKSKKMNIIIIIIIKFLQMTHNGTNMIMWTMAMFEHIESNINIIHHLRQSKMTNH